MRPDPRNRRAFTLVELLVVVSIIALLIGILIPAVGRARAVAERVACLSNLRGIGMGVNIYASEWNGWLPGPHTSGSASRGVAIYPPSISDTTPSDEGPSTEPMSNFDWWSPALGDSFNLPENHFERYNAISNHKAKCPTNKLKYDSGNFGFSPSILSEFPDMNFTSYSMLVNFATWPEIELPYGSGRPEISNDKLGVTPPSAPESFMMEYPSGYAPKIDRVGNPATKVAVTEGARGIDAGDQLSANGAKYQIEGGSFMLEAPILSNAYDRTPWGPSVGFPTDGTLPDGPPSSISAEAAFRHGGGMNRVFFDGHGEYASFEEVFIPEPYIPSGTVLGSRYEFGRFAADTNDITGRTYETGTVIE